jgi:methylmalonyl-CoA/ethylmalonyl-CoA epimerase
MAHIRCTTATVYRGVTQRPSLKRTESLEDPVVSAVPVPAVPAVFTGIDHVGVAVPDFDEAVEYYARTFGMRVAHEEVNEEQGVREAMLAVGDTDDPAAPKIQLLAPLTSESTIAKFLDRNGPGVQQVAYRVADIDAACATLRERGLRLLYETPKRGTSDSRVNFVHPKDAGGILVELVEPAASH